MCKAHGFSMRLCLPKYSVCSQYDVQDVRFQYACAEFHSISRYALLDFSRTVQCCVFMAVCGNPGSFRIRVFPRLAAGR